MHLKIIIQYLREEHFGNFDKFERKEKRERERER